MTGQGIGNTGTIVLADALKHNTLLKNLEIISETTHDTVFRMNQSEIVLLIDEQMTRLGLKEQLH